MNSVNQLNDNQDDQSKTDLLIEKMRDKDESEAFRYSDKLAAMGGDYVKQKMIELLYDDDYETKYLAARTLGKIEDNASALDPLLDAINHKKNQNQNGGMADALVEFDCSEKFVELLKLYLFGNFKVSATAKIILDSEEFNITPRTIRKAEKHWNHYLNNVKQDEAFEEKKQEVETMLSELKALFGE